MCIRDRNAALELRENIKKIRAQLLGCAASEVDFDGKEVYIINPDGADTVSYTHL